MKPSTKPAEQRLLQALNFKLPTYNHILYTLHFDFYPYWNF